MKRWRDEAHIAKRNWFAHRRMHVELNIGAAQGFGPAQKSPGFDPFEVDCRCDDQPGRFRKRKPFGCGNPRCGLCHGYKFPTRIITRREQLAKLAFREQVRELGSHG